MSMHFIFKLSEKCNKDRSAKNMYSKHKSFQTNWKATNANLLIRYLDVIRLLTVAFFSRLNKFSVVIYE